MEDMESQLKALEAQLKAMTDETEKKDDELKRYKADVENKWEETMQDMVMAKIRVEKTEREVHKLKQAEEVIEQLVAKVVLLETAAQQKFSEVERKLQNTVEAARQELGSRDMKMNELVANLQAKFMDVDEKMQSKGGEMKRRETEGFLAGQDDGPGEVCRRRTEVEEVAERCSEVFRREPRGNQCHP